MNTDITVAILTAIASLFVAIVSLVAALANGRQTARYVERLEVLKNTFAEKQNQDEVRRKYLDEMMKSLQESIQAIQRVKDDVQLVGNALPSSLDADVAIARIRAGREAIFACYEVNLSCLDEEDERALHRAKNAAVTIEGIVSAGLHGKTDAHDLSSDDRVKLMTLRGNLTETQQLLRDSRMSRLVEAIKHD